jgi:hypothetical protein
MALAGLSYNFLRKPAIFYAPLKPAQQPQTSSHLLFYAVPGQQGTQRTLYSLPCILIRLLDNDSCIAGAGDLNILRRTFTAKDTAIGVQFIIPQQGLPAKSNQVFNRRELEDYFLLHVRSLRFNVSEAVSSNIKVKQPIPSSC